MIWNILLNILSSCVKTVWTITAIVVCHTNALPCIRNTRNLVCMNLIVYCIQMESEVGTVHRDMSFRWILQTSWEEKGRVDANARKCVISYVSYKNLCNRGSSATFVVYGRSGTILYTLLPFNFRPPLIFGQGWTKIKGVQKCHHFRWTKIKGSYFFFKPL